ncbi:MAG: DUF501 domain-containing protein [Halieaceae bacterium]
MMEVNLQVESLAQDTHDAVAKLLGREPRGLRAVPVLNNVGQPSVIRVGSLVDGKPFPTLFWLVDAELCYRIDTAEATGLIQRLQQQVDADPELLCAMAADHKAHIALRNRYIDEQEKSELQALGFYEVLQNRGIGGIADFTRIRCLHTWYGAHLVEANTIGRLLDAYWASGE